MPDLPINILFIFNPRSGTNKNVNWQQVINDYFKATPHSIKIFTMTGGNDTEAIREIIKTTVPQKVVAVGGDGTVSYLAQLLAGTGIAMGILPAGSANGMATELNIPNVPEKALDIIANGHTQICDAILINGKVFCIHLSDIGMNAQLIKYFDESELRGMWNYARMLVKAMIRKRIMRVTIKIDDQVINTSAYMIVIANASKYGTGAVINPDASMGDGKFELVIVKKIALSEFIKLFWSYKTFNPEKVEIFKTTKAEITTKHRVHFQVDGEHKGKVKKVSAKIIPSAFKLLIPK